MDGKCLAFEAAAVVAPRDADVDSSYHHLRAKFVPPKAEADGQEEQQTTGRHEEAASTAPVSTQGINEYDSATERRDGARVAFKDGGHATELCMYIQRLEADKRDLIEQVRFHRDASATHQAKLLASTRRVDALEATLSTARDVAGAQQRAASASEKAIAAECERGLQQATRIQELELALAEAEDARQRAVLQLSQAQNSALSTTSRVPNISGNRGPWSESELDAGSGSSQRVEKYKREIDLLRHKLELRETQSHEKQKLAVDLALRHAHADHSAALEKLRLEYEIKLSQWRQEAVLRAKETEAAMEEDRYSIRLEMRHGMQRAYVDQRAYYLNAHAALEQQQTLQRSHKTRDLDGSEKSSSEDNAVVSAMDEVLVRMQLELLRTRRFAALKKLILIRQTHTDRALGAALTRWKTMATQAKIFRLNAVLHMHRIVTHLESRKVRAFFHDWKVHITLRRAHTSQRLAISCWNRLLAVERLNHVVQQHSIKRLMRALNRWRWNCSNGSDAERDSTGSEVDGKHNAQSESHGGSCGSNTIGSVSDGSGGVVGAELQVEIKKLHDQLASSKSEAWRYKRQLLKQFL